MSGDPRRERFAVDSAIAQVDMDQKTKASAPLPHLTSPFFGTFLLCS